MPPEELTPSTPDTPEVPATPETPAAPAANIPAPVARQSVTSIFDEVKAEAEAAERAAEAPPETPETPETPAEPEPTAEEKQAAEDQKAEALKKLDGKTEEELEKLTSASPEDLTKLAAREALPSDTPAEQTIAEQVMELLKDGATLEAALRQAGADHVRDMPLVKELLGRERQSTEDRLKSERAKADWQRQAIDEVQQRGRRAAFDVFAEIDKLTKAIEEDSTELAVPSKEFLGQKFQEYSDGAVNAYHNQTWGELSNIIYDLPEIKFAPDDAKAELAKFNGRPPEEWLAAHLEVGRQTLWRTAQEQVAEAAKKAIDDERTTMTAAHKVEVEKLTAKSEKTMKAAVDEARKAARAEAMAEFGKNGAPPRLPSKESPAEGAQDISGNSIPEIWASAKAQAERSGTVS